MQLHAHLKASNKSVAQFAREVGAAENTIRKIVYGQRQPSLGLAVRIAAATGGEVSETDLMIRKVAA